MADEIKTPRRSHSEVAEFKAGNRKAVKARQRADKLEHERRVSLAGKLYYIRGIKDHSQIAKIISDTFPGKTKPPIRPQQVIIYLRRFRVATAKQRGDNFKDLLDDLKISFQLSHDERIRERQQQLQILLAKQKSVDENGNIKYSADSELVAQIRLCLDSIAADQKTTTELLQKAGVIDAVPIDVHSSELHIFIPDNGRGDEDKN